MSPLELLAAALTVAALTVAAVLGVQQLVDDVPAAAEDAIASYDTSSLEALLDDLEGDAPVCVR